MPKMKTKSSAKKRFSLTGTGKIKRKHAYKSHILTKKTKKQKRNLTYKTIVDPAKISKFSSFKATAQEGHEADQGPVWPQEKCVDRCQECI